MTVVAPAAGHISQPLFELTQAVAAARSSEEIYTPALECLRASIGAERSAILLLDSAGVMRFKAWAGLSDEYRATVEGHSPWLPDDPDPQPVLVHDALRESELEALKGALQSERIGSLAFIPLTAAGRLLGKFMLYFPEPREFTRQEIMAAQTIAANVAFAIDQHQLREERQVGAELLAAQKRSLELLVSGAPLEPALETLSSAAVALCPGLSSARFVVLPFEPDLGPERDGSVSSLLPTRSDAGPDNMWHDPLILSDGSVVAIFEAQLDNSHGPTPQEREIVGLLEHTAAVVIERVRIRTERRRQRGRTDAIFRSTIVGVAELAPDGTFVTVNDRFCEIARRRRDELSGLDSALLLHPDDREATRAGFDELRAGASSFTLEKRVRRPDGSDVWVEDNVSAIHDGQGTLLGAVAITTDVTERRTAETAVRESEARYRTLIDSMGVAAYTTDANGYITMFNEAATNLWGRAPEIGKDMWCGSWRIRRIDGQPLPHPDCPMGVALREQRPVRDVEIIAERPDGSSAVVMPYPTPFFDEDGRLAGAINVLVDVTEQHRVQAALREAIQAKDDFLGQMSHELRNPVTQLEGLSGLLVRRSESLSKSDQQEFLGEMHVQSARVRRLVENMIVLSRFERGMMPGVEPHLLQHLLTETIQEFRRRFPSTDIQVDIPRDLPPVETSTSTVDQVVWNLLTNAYKYGPPNGPIHLRAGLDGGKVFLAVRDHGPGLPEEDMDQLFRPYFRSVNTPEHAAGLGLGLSVCKRLMEAQDGEMWARRHEEGGMEFGLRLRALEA